MDDERKSLYSWKNISVLVPKNPRALLSIFKSLKHRYFALYFGGMLFSLIGAWIQQVAMGWLVYNVTNSVFILSLSVFLSQIPALVFTPFAGVVADRFNRRNILIVTQLCMMSLSFILAVMTLVGFINIGVILLICFVSGIVFSFDAPARQSLYSKLVPPEDLGNAIALNSTAINGTRFVGPAIGGSLIASIGEGYCFLINGFCYFAILFSLYMIKLSSERSHSASGRFAKLWKALRISATCAR